MTALELAELIETRLAAIEAEKPADRRDTWGWRAYYEKGRDLVAELVRDHGASAPKTHDAHRFRFAGIECSCTISELQLLRAWAAKARKAES